MAIKLGDQVPYFKALNSKGESIESTSFIGVQPVVLYFYPKDDTPGCTAQACTFRDHFSDYQSLGAVIIGVSADDVRTHQRFQNKYQLPFELLSDPKQEIRRLFGVPTNLFGLLPGRVTYIIDSSGKVVGIHDSQLPGKHHTKSIELLNKLG
jgi:peroxiredoxin Q/BCP